MNAWNKESFPECILRVFVELYRCLFYELANKRVLSILALTYLYASKIREHVLSI